MGTISSKESSKRKSLTKSIKRKSRIETYIPTVQSTPVHLVKHQVVLSDYVPPLSSLSAIPQTSWRKSTITDSSGYEESPRTSLGSDPGFFKVDDKSTAIISSYKKDRHNIIFESKYQSTSPLPNFNDTSKKPFWSYTQGDERDYDRQLRQHYVLKHVLQGNLHVPVSADQPMTILDAGCGAGFWTMDMATAYPNATMISLDAFPHDDKKRALASNVMYQQCDFDSPLALPSHSLDIVYQRDTARYIHSKRWPFLLSEYERLLKRGGYIEIVDYEFCIRDPGPVLALVNEWYRIASASVGVDVDSTKQMDTWLCSAGFQNVQKKVVSIPIGEWPADEKEKENGFLYKQVIRALFKSLKPWWIYELGVSEQEYDKVISAAMEELDEQCCSIDWFIFTAEKSSTL